MTNLEKLMYSTIRLQSDNSTATGFIFSFNIGNEVVDTIITNRHFAQQVKDGIIDYSLMEQDQYITINMHTNDDSFITFSLKVRWYLHPHEDLCFCFLKPVLEKFKFFKKKYKISFLDERSFANDLEIKKMQPIERILMIGYPNGMYDEYHNLPICRNGYTASSPKLNFNNEPKVLVDIAAYPGSSGSPVFISLDDSKAGYIEKPLLVGVLSQAVLRPQRIVSTETGEDISSIIALSESYLGLYIKIEKILDFKDTIKAKKGHY